MSNETYPHKTIGGKKKISIKVFGIGSAGCKVVEQMIKRGFPGVVFAALNTDEESLAQSAATEKFPVDGKRLHRVGVDSDADRVRAALGEELSKMKAACQGVDAVFVITGMGGKTGTILSPVVAQAAKEAGALVLAFAAMPFDYEGGRRKQQARRGLEHLKAAADGVICLPNQRIFKLIDASTSLRDTFRISNELLAEGVRGIWRLLNYTALIEIHFADLCALVRDRHGESAFAVAEATGPDRAREVMEKLLAHPMLDGGKLLSTSDTVLVSLKGGPDLTTADVNRVMEQINHHCEHSQVIMGAAMDEEFRDRLSVIVIATHGEAQGAVERPEQSTGVAKTHRHSGKTELHDHLLSATPTARPASRFVPPPPTLTTEKMEQLMARQSGGRSRKSSSKMSQGQLPLEIVSKGRFEKSQPTIYKGEDLDVPTYIRRGVVLN